MRVLGLTAFHRDAAAAIVENGETIAAAAEERFTRVKHDSSFPRRGVRFCLGQASSSARELDWVAFAEKPSRRFERLLAEEITAFPRSWLSFPRVLFPWFGDRLWVRGRVSDELGIEPEKVLFVDNQRAKAANAFFLSPFEEAAILVADEALEWAATTLARGKGSDLEILAEIHHPHSLGLLAATASERLGLGGADGIGRLFALAGCGEPRFAAQVGAALHLEADGSYALETDQLEAALSPTRDPGAALLWTGADRRHADLAASVARVLGDAFLHLARELHRRAPSENLCFGGALAGSADLNARLLAEGPFRRLFVPPAPGDAGAALGAALAVVHELEHPARKPLAHAFLGEEVLEAEGSGGLKASDETEIVDRFVEALAGGRCAGWVRGRFEWGARALGHRSILAAPHTLEMRDRLNREIKFREEFRPFAPVVPIEAADRYFEVPPGGARLARFMSGVFPVRREWRARLAAITHVDGTARLQTLERAMAPLLYNLLEAYGRRSGIPVLLNTSFNLAGEPIVSRAVEGYSTFRRSGIDVLVAGRTLMMKRASSQTIPEPKIACLKNVAR